MFSFKIAVKRDEVIGWSTKGPSNLIFLGYEFVTGHFAKKKSVVIKNHFDETCFLIIHKVMVQEVRYGHYIHQLKTIASSTQPSKNDGNKKQTCLLEYWSYTKTFSRELKHKCLPILYLDLRLDVKCKNVG